MAEVGTISLLEPPLRDDTPLWDLWLGAYHYAALTVADEIGLFSALAAAPATADELATRLSLGPRGAEALLAVLAALDMLVQREGRFHLTDLARTYPLPDAPLSYCGMLRSAADRPAIHDALREALRADRPWAAPGHGALTDDWAAGDLSPEQAEVVTAFMHSISFPAAAGVARYGDFTGVRRILDVAGGSGCFCIALAPRYPDLPCTVLELPAVCAVAERYIARYGLADRIATAARNMFVDPWPPRHDAVFFSNIFHDWDRESCLHLVRRAYEALPPGGRIYVHEMVLADGKDGPLAAAGLFLVLLLDTRGKQFTLGELTDILQEAGFTGVASVPTHPYFSLVSAQKP